MFTNIKPNNELTNLVMWITSRGYDVRMNGSVWGVSIKITRKGKYVHLTEQATDVQAARKAKEYLEKL